MCINESEETANLVENKIPFSEEMDRSIEHNDTDSILLQEFNQLVHSHVSESYEILHRTISSRELNNAKNIIYQFLTEQNPQKRMCNYASSSWGMVNHYLCKNEETLYGFYTSTGTSISILFRVHPHFIENIFQDDARLPELLNILGV